MKVCTKCGREFPATLEYFRKAKPGKLRANCRLCDAKFSRNYYKEHYPEQRDRILSYKKEYYREHKDQRKQYYNEHREQCRESCKRWNEENRDARRSWYLSNKERVNANYRKRLLENPTFHISETISARISQSLKSKGGSKGGKHWETLVGYTSEELKVHLETKFQCGMSWENYGYRGWHIDHIRPIDSFCYTSTDDPEFKKCWSLDNLQPMWAKENLSKHSKWNPESTIGNPPPP